MTAAPVCLGIDPGLMGALCWMDASTSAVLHIADLPVTVEGKKKSIDAVAFMALLKRHPRPCRAVVELVGSRPTDSRPGAFTFGRNLGAIEALIQAHEIPLQRVAPLTWRKAAGLVAGVGKEASLAAALRLHPSARPFLEGKQARHDRGDAVLIASWGVWMRRGGVGVKSR